MSLREKYEQWSGQGGHQASGNAKAAGSAATNFFQDTYAKGFTVGAQQGQTDFNLDRVEKRDIPSTKFASAKYDEGNTYSENVGER